MRDRLVCIAMLACLAAACHHDVPVMPPDDGGANGPDLPAPQLTNASPGVTIGGLVVSWRALQGAYSYNLYWGTNPRITKENATRVDGIVDVFYQFSDLDPLTVYYFFLTAVDGTGESPPSLTLSATPLSHIHITIKNPGLNPFEADVLTAVVTLESEFPLSGVTASIYGRSTTLAGGPSINTWIGSLSLDGVPRGATPFVLTASDLTGKTSIASKGFIHDAPPKITVVSPEEFSVARPNIHLAATCEDDAAGGCSWIAVSAWNYYKGQNSIDVDDPLAPADGQEVDVDYRAADSVAQQVRQVRTVFVDSSTQISEVSQLHGLILDVQPDRILFRRDSADHAVLAIHDRASGQDEVVFDSAKSLIENASLTPVGALFIVRNTQSSATKLYEWRQGSLAELGAGQLSVGLRQVAGPFAVWSANFQLILRDLVTGMDEILPAEVQVSDLADNGDIVWNATSGGHSQIFLRRAGVTTQLTTATDADSYDPRTDGINVVYRKVPICCAMYWLAKYGTGGEELLTPNQGAGGLLLQGVHYLANNGWIAYTQESPTGGPRQVWTRSPTGEKRQLSAFAKTSELERVGPNGEVVFGNLGRFFVRSVAGAVPRRVNSRLGRAYLEAADLFVAIGRSLFRAN